MSNRNSANKLGFIGLFTLHSRYLSRLKVENKECNKLGPFTVDNTNYCCFKSEPDLESDP